MRSIITVRIVGASVDGLIFIRLIMGRFIRGRGRFVRGRGRFIRSRFVRGRFVGGWFIGSGLVGSWLVGSWKRMIFLLVFP